jgi:predicted nucleic acid-binding protein
LRSAIDTNVISALWARQKEANEARALLQFAAVQGTLVISGPVYSELIAFPGVSVAFVDGFLRKTAIVVESDYGLEVWREAGVRFAQYAVRRRAGVRGSPRRLLADFVIGAHALFRADRLLTFNVGDYRTDFPELLLVSSGAVT